MKNEKNELYANEYNKENNQMNNEVINEEKNTEFSRIKLPENVSNITIESLEPYFTPDVLHWFERLEIKNLEDLVNFVNQPKAFAKIKNKDIREQIFGTTLLLKCKFLNEDPGINIRDEKTKLEEINDRLGLSHHAYMCLLRYGYGNLTVKDFFEEVSGPDFWKRLSKGNNIGSKTMKEIGYKVRIVNDFEKNKKANEDTIHDQIDTNKLDSNRTLESLYNELIRLRAQSQEIDEKINMVLDEIQEKKMSESQGTIKR